DYYCVVYDSSTNILF
nr:immunoglobulin light chain junction region [Macaca mulatta]MOX33095.1 immunoglobulin light chain junction region [Macaca mulatta]